MKKTLAILLISLISVTVYGQNYKDSDYYYYDGIENRGDMGINSDQKNKIISIKKNIGRRHAAIGRDRSLRGYEKGQAHRNLNLQVKKEIYEVLNSNQRNDWDKGRTNGSTASSSTTESFGNWNKKYDAIENDIDALEDKIDDMEDYYDDLIDAVEDNKSLSKSERNARKNALKSEMKAKKREMKREKQTLKDSRYY